jgi:general secretion pathway protein K
MMKKKRKARERGVALVMVLGAIAVLTVMLAEFQEEASAELAAAVAERDQVQAEYFARSAVNLSRLLVAAEPTMRQAIAPLFMLMKRTPPQLPVWEFSDRLLAAFNDQEASGDFASTLGLDMSLGKNLGLKGGRFEVQIVDEDAKLNVNQGAANDFAKVRLARQLMAEFLPPANNPIFEMKDQTGNFHDRGQVCAALIDWADADEAFFTCDIGTSAASGSAVEDSYYQVLAKPFRRKNAPYDSLEEIHQVRGVSDDFWATFVDPEPTDPKKRNFTVWGQGTVNVNSANPMTLWTVVCAGAIKGTEICEQPLQTQMFIMGVTMARGVSMGAPLWGSPGDFVRMMKGEPPMGPLLTTMGMKPVKFQSDSDFAKTIATESKVFSVYAVGVVKGYKRETRTKIHAVIDFRPPPTSLPGLPGMPAPTPVPTATATATAPGGLPLPPGTTDPNALRPATGGQVLYYKVE